MKKTEHQRIDALNCGVGENSSLKIGGGGSQSVLLWKNKASESAKTIKKIKSTTWGRQVTRDSD